MTVDLDELLRTGGKELVELMQFAVWSVQLEPVFVVLVGDYRSRATAPRALALYDVFCAPGAPARLRAEAVLPPRDLRLERDLRPLRQAAEGAPPLLPPRHLFDFVVADLSRPADGPLAAIARQFDPTLSPAEHMPDGRLSPGQRSFVEKVWRARLRPQLVAAGFARAAALGG